MQILKKIKRLFSYKSYTDEEHQLTEEIYHYFWNKINFNGENEHPKNLEEYLLLHFRAMNVLNHFYAYSNAQLAYSLIDALFSIEQNKEIEKNGKKVIKFFLEWQNQEMIVCTLEGLDSMKQTLPSYLSRSLSQSSISLGEMKAIYEKIGKVK